MSKPIQNIEFMAKCYEAITNQINMDKPFPQDIKAKVKTNLICKRSRSSGVIKGFEKKK